MDIKLPHMPFKFDSPEGRMEITVRRGTPPAGSDRLQAFSAAVTFLQPGPLALQRIPLAAKSETYAGAMTALTEGFKVNLAAHEEHSVEFRVLTALCHAKGVVDLDS
jgi:hypothetical protein